MMNLPERCETGLMPLGDSRGSFCVWTKEKPRECGDKILSQQSTAFFYGSPRECGEKVTTALILRVTPASAGKSPM